MIYDSKNGPNKSNQPITRIIKRMGISNAQKLKRLQRSGVLTSPQVKGWEERFNKKFVGIESGFGDWLTVPNGRKIKRFISSLLLQQKKELLEKLEELETFKVTYHGMVEPNPSVVLWVRKDQIIKIIENHE